ncbi:MAG: hypothetical protein CMB48_03110 [Euryarchaeota archaeon]|nr:hypothetical protein [Euryarchaeota archaeon]
MQSRELLEEYDSNQSEMMDESCIQVTSEDLVVGPISKFEAHRDEGILHRAFSVLMFDSQNRLLIQKRSDDKITFPGYWANSCCSHPLYDYGELETASEIGVAKAAIRKIPQELGINTSNMTPSNFNLIGRFEYKARAKSGWVEHEVDYVIGTHSDAELNINLNEVSEYKWLSKDELKEFCEDDMENIAPWFLAIIETYLTNWWPNGPEDYPKYDMVIVNKGVLE